MYLNNSNVHVFSSNNAVSEIREEHNPYFLINWGSMTEKAKNDLVKYAQQDRNILSLGKTEIYNSSVNFTKNKRQQLEVKRVFCSHPGVVPEVSDTLFLRYRKHNVELFSFDIPYRTLVLLENAASNIPNYYMFNTNNEDEIIKILTYDIETLKDGSICILGYSSFDITINSFVDLKTETMNFEIVDYPDWKDLKVEQFIAKPEEESDILLQFIELMMKHDIVCGHNILAFDNKEFKDRVVYHKKAGSYSQVELKIIDEFLKIYSQDINMFNFGKSDKGVLFYPNSLDTLLAFQRLYTNLEQYNLKFLAKEFGIDIKDRVYFTTDDFNKTDKKIFKNKKLFDKFIKYNEHDIIEQNGLTIIALQQVLPMSFFMCQPLDEIVLKQNTKMWDGADIVRKIFHKRIFNPTISASRVAKELHKKTDAMFLTKEEFKSFDTSNKELLKLIKYGNEAPQFVEYPILITDADTTGGMTLHADTDLGTDFLPCYDGIKGDVTALYPTLLRAKNSCCDTVRFAYKNERKEICDWIWLKDISDDLKSVLDKCPYIWREPTKEYMDSGIELAVVISNDESTMAMAMGGLLELTKKIKKQKAEEKDKDKKKSLGYLYDAIKASRNAGTHGIELSADASCRQYNLAGGSLIPTTGQEVLFYMYTGFKEINALILNGDTDGIDIGCSSSPGLYDLSNKDKVIEVINKTNEYWMEKLDYDDFDISPEYFDFYLMIKHKNYIYNSLDDLKMKGVSFKAKNKSRLGQTIIKEVIIDSVKDIGKWSLDDKESVKKQVRNNIIEFTNKAVESINMKEVDMKDLILYEYVKPISSYKKLTSIYAVRTKAIEKVVGYDITHSQRFGMLISKNPLPGITKISPKGTKAIHYLWPIDHIKQEDIDLNWYQENVRKYIYGAFGIGKKQTKSKVKEIDKNQNTLADFM